MTVKELIEKLQALPTEQQVLPVVISDENGTDTVGKIDVRHDYNASYCLIVELRKQ